MTTVRGISSMATRAMLAELVAAFEKVSSHRIAIESVGGVDAAKRVASGAAFDLVILGSDAIDKLMASGAVEKGSRVDLVQSPIAIAIKKGATHADISSATALKSTLLAATSVSYSTGPSGVYLARLFEKMGIAEQIKAKTTVPPPGVPVGSLVAQGQAQIGFQQLSELIHVQGIDVLGLLPEEVAYLTTFSAAIPTQARTETRAAVHDFLAFANSPASIPIKQSQGMIPISN